jgi:hypothetical protein
MDRARSKGGGAARLPTQDYMCPHTAQALHGGDAKVNPVRAALLPFLFRGLPSLAVALAAGTLPACSSADATAPDSEDSDVTSTTPPSADEAKACQAGTVGKNLAGDSVLKCTQPFDTAPSIRLPADKKTGKEVTLYAGGTVPTDFSGAFVLWGRDGSLYLPVDASNAPIAYADGAKKLPKTMHAPTNRMGFTIYQFTGTLGGAVDSPHGAATAIHLKTARPVVEIDGCAMDSRMLGTWDGTVSERLETPTGGGPLTKNFDESKRVPIHVTFDGIAKHAPLSDYTGGKVLKDAATFDLTGTIDNFDHDVTVDGKKYPSLQAMGAKNPFLGAKDGKIDMYRLGNMHGQQNDAHWVLTYPAGSENLSGNGMSYTLTSFTAPAMLFNAGVTAEPIDQLEIKPHIPFLANGHSVLLSPVKIGEKMGQCGE